MIYLDPVKCICCQMLGCLLQITDTGCIFEFFNDRIQPILCDDTFIFFQTDPLQYLWHCKYTEDDLLFFKGIIRYVDNRKT